jgi:predicted DNA-binding transcriptional regulator AlpA
MMGVPFNPADEIYLSLRRVAERYTMSTRKVYRLMAGNIFPKPVKIGGSSKWALSDLVRYEDELKKKGGSK